MNLKLSGYTADHARNTVAGTASPDTRAILDLCLEAHQAGLEATRPGVTVMEVVKTMTDVIADGGWAEWDWLTGHGFGLDLAEDPFFIPTNHGAARSRHVLLPRADDHPHPHRNGLYRGHGTRDRDRM